MREAVTIILPLPGPLLSPNRPVFSRGGRIAQAKAAKAYRIAARTACEAEQVATGPWKSATAQASFYWPAKRRRDIRNAEAMLKPAYDGLVEAGLLADDDEETLAHEPTCFDIDRRHPRVELRITRKDA